MEEQIISMEDGYLKTRVMVSSRDSRESGQGGCEDWPHLCRGHDLTLDDPGGGEEFCVDPRLGERAVPAGDVFIQQLS